MYKGLREAQNGSLEHEYNLSGMEYQDAQTNDYEYHPEATECSYTKQFIYYECTYTHDEE
jgi:hypothetical protein